MQPEHISDVIPRAMNGVTKTTAIVPSTTEVVRESDTNPPSPLRHRKPRTLHDLVEALRERESYENEDLVLETKTLRFTADGLVEAPGKGVFQLNDWSRSQLASRVGLAGFDRYFENATGSQRSDEMNQRFARGAGTLRLRTRRLFDDEEPVVRGTSGVLTALLSSSYTPVPDSVTASKLEATLENADEAEVVRFELTEMTTTIWVKLGDAYRKDEDPHAEIGALWGSIAIRNSSTGFASLSILLSLIRLVCLNGMTAPSDSIVLRRAHRGLDDLGAIDAKLKLGLENVGPRLHASTRTLVASLKHAVPNIEEEVKAVLQRARLPKRFLQGVLAAYAREPKQSAFGISQALTLAAQTFSAEDRFELERAAGSYLRQFAPS